jgi:hypothetical protein
MVPLPDNVYVPFRVAWEQFGAGACAFMADAARSRVRIEPIVAKPGLFRFAFSIPISIASWGPENLVMMLVPPAPIPRTGGKKGHRAIEYFVIASQPA